MGLHWDQITHITKVDPVEEPPPDLGILDRTDAVIVGGSDGVTARNALDTIQIIKHRFPEKVVVQEPYNSSHVSTDTVKAADHLIIPAVYNGDREHFVGKHVSLFTEVGSKPEELPGVGLPVLGDLIAAKGLNAISRMANKIIGEGYVVQNLESKAANVSGVSEPYSSEQVAGAALATEAFYGFPCSISSTPEPTADPTMSSRQQRISMRRYFSTVAASTVNNGHTKSWMPVRMPSSSGIVSTTTPCDSWRRFHQGSNFHRFRPAYGNR